MKVLASILVLCSVAFYAHAHVVYSEWTVVDTVCQRPSTGACAQAGTCCGEKSGTQRLTRTCVEDHCESAMLAKTQDCNIRCGEADANAYGPWVRAGNCERPASGRCSTDGTCCGEVEGTMKHTRECKAANGCTSSAHSGSGSTLERQFKCNLRCGFVNPCKLYPNPCANGGTCVEDGHSHSCNCAGGWTGHHCDQRTGGA